MKEGFVPALGTPLDEGGKLIADSYARQIDDQIRAGAVGLLAMGSMGIQAFIKNDVYPTVAKAAVDAAAGRVPVFIGAMDTSVARAGERMARLEELDIAGFVLTAPYYSPTSKKEMMNFFRGAAGKTERGILLYDLPGVTQSKITYDMVLELLREAPNFKGIKSADTAMFRKLRLCQEVPNDFIMVYSGLDTFDVAYKWGITNCLDGMLSCTPMTTGRLFSSMERGDYKAAGELLDGILSLRDLFISRGLWGAYTACMNLLGYEGNYGPDYTDRPNEEDIAMIGQKLRELGELR